MRKIFNKEISYSLERKASSKLKRKKRARRITAVALVVVMLFASLFTTTILSDSAVVVQAAESGPSVGVSERISDSDTMDTYAERLIDEETGSRYSGRLWADKSVFDYGNDVTLDMETDGYNGTVSSSADFLHAFSALGSSQVVTDIDIAPLDVVFVLDVSGSMEENDAGMTMFLPGLDVTKFVNMIDALNEAMRMLMGYNEDFKTSPYNRLGLVTFADEIGSFSLSLDRYKLADNKDTFFDINCDKYASGSYNLTTLRAEAQEFTNSEGYKYEKGYMDPDFTVHNGFRAYGQTYTQGGLSAGMAMLAEEEETSIVVDSKGELIPGKKTPGAGEKILQRQPIVILLSDGEPNQIIEQNEWWGDLRPTPTDRKQPTNFYSTTYNTGDAVAGFGFATLATGAYWKQQVNKNYFGDIAPQDSKTELYAVGLNLPTNSNTSNRSGYNKGDLSRIIIDPTNLTNDSEVANEIVAKKINQYWSDYINSNGGKIDVNMGRRANGSGPVTYEFYHPDSDDISSLNYVDTSKIITSGYEIKSVFSDIIKNVAQGGKVFTPLSGSNGAGVEDSLTYVDPIGEYMEIKDDAVSVNDGAATDMSMLLLGEMYDIEKYGVYDYNFNDVYKQHHLADYPGYDPDDTGTYIVLEDGWYSSDDPETAEFLGSGADDGSWEDGNVWYVSYETAIDFVPTLAELTDVNRDGRINGFDATDKQKNTVYKLYTIPANDRFHRNDWRLNPAYAGRVPGLTEADYDSNFVFNPTRQAEFNQLTASGDTLPNGVYRLSDLRIWVEDTGDYKDKYPDDSLFVGMGYDQALYTNVPAAALPIQVADIILDSQGVASYVTNRGAEHPGANQDFYYKQSTPLRVFYSVGLQSKILSDGGVDLTKVSQTYLDSHRNEDNSVYFLSNYFTGDKKEDYKGQGDPVITFSPDVNNRYYVFQKTLMFYTRAYSWNGVSFDEIQSIKTGQGGELKGTFENLTEATAAARAEGYDIGDIVFLSGDVATEVQRSEDANYFWTFEYYRSDGSAPRAENAPEGATGGEIVQWVLARTGAEFAAVNYDNLTATDMVEWFNPETGETRTLDASAADGNKPGDGWVIATKKGGLRLSELIAMTKKNNATGTAEDYYIPLISANSGSGSDVLVNGYLGNNGRISIEDTLFLVTKNVEPQPGTQLTASQLNNTKFNYQIYIEEFSGLHSAIKAKYDEAANVWWRMISSIDVLTNNQGFIEYANDETIVTVNADGEQTPTGAYYVYLPTDEEEEGITAALAFSADEDGNITLGSTKRNGNSVDFMVEVAYLVPVASVNDSWSFPENTDESNLEGLGIKVLDDFVILNMMGGEIHDRGSGYGPTSDYAVRTQYAMVELVFGVGYELEDGVEVDFEAPTGLYDSNSFNAGGDDDEAVDAETIAAHTAQFTLANGEGLLFNSIKSGGDYRVTEKMTDMQVKEGWSLWNDNDKASSPHSFHENLKVAVRHLQQNPYINYDSNGKPTDIYGTDNDGYLWQWDEENGKYVSPSGEEFENTAHFDAENHTYSVFGDTAFHEEAVQYTNTLVPASLTLSKKVEGEPADGDVYTFNIELYELDDTGAKVPLADGVYHAFIHPTNHLCYPVENHPHVEGAATGNCDKDLILKNGKGSVVLKNGETYVISGLPQGTYYKITEEIKAVEGVAYEYITGFDITDDRGTKHVNGLTAEGNLNTANENGVVDVVRVSYTNTAAIPEPADLTFSKTVDSFGNIGKNTEWHFTVTLKLPVGTNISSLEYEGGVLSGFTGVEPPKGGSVTLTRQADGTYTASFTLKHGQKITLKDVPFKTEYSITEAEANQDGYVTTVSGDPDGILATDRTADFVNTPYGSIEIDKEVLGGIFNGREFNFTVTLNGNELDPDTFVVSGDSEVEWSVDDDDILTGSFTLSSGQKIRIDNIPAGTEYEFKEEKLDGYSVKKTDAKGIVPVNDTAAAHFVNVLLFNLPTTGGTGDMLFKLLILGAALIIGGTSTIMYTFLKKKRR